jgi:hypothetical protein
MKKSPVNRPIYNVISPEFCQSLQQQYPELKQYDIHQVIADFNDHMTTVATTERDGILLPSYIGNMFISLFPTSMNKYILARSLDAVKRNFEYSITSADGYRPRIMYTTSNVAAKFAHAKYWGFEPGDASGYNPIPQLLQKVSVAFKANWKKWIILPNTRFVKELFRKKKYIETVRAADKERLKDYDEFKFD